MRQLGIVASLTLVALALVAVSASQASQPDLGFGEAGYAEVVPGNETISYLESAGDFIFAVNDTSKPGGIEVVKLTIDGDPVPGSPFKLSLSGLPEGFLWVTSELSGIEPTVDGGLLIGGSSKLVGVWRPWLIKLDVKGELDRTFGQDGLMLRRDRFNGSIRRLNDFAADARGRIYLLREESPEKGSNAKSATRFLAQRLTASGRPDRSFGKKSVVRLLTARADQRNRFIDSIQVFKDGTSFYETGGKKGRLALDPKGRTLSNWGRSKTLKDSWSWETAGNSAFGSRYQKAKSPKTVGERVDLVTKIDRRGRTVKAFGRGGLLKINRSFIRNLIGGEAGEWQLKGQLGTDVRASNDGKVVLSVPVVGDGRAELLFTRLMPSGAVDRNFGEEGVFRAAVPKNVGLDSARSLPTQNLLLVGDPSKARLAALVRIDGR